jgi:hypothetical protein
MEDYSSYQSLREQSWSELCLSQTHAMWASLPHQGLNVNLSHMRQPLLATLVLIATCSLALSCGGGSMAQPLSLIVQPASASAFTNYATGYYQGATLTATLSNGAIPTGVQWKTSNACVAVNNNANTTTVICNFSCSGAATATITATAQGLTGTSSVTCTWTT